MTVLKRATVISSQDALVILSKKTSDLKNFGLTSSALDHIKKAITADRKSIQVCNNGQSIFVIIKPEKETPAKITEVIRKAGSSLISFFNDQKIAVITIADADKKDDHLLALAEGIALSNYQFLLYKVNKEKEMNSLNTINLFSKTIKQQSIDRLAIVIDATCIARNLVNEPPNSLDAVSLSKEFVALGK